MLDKFKRRLLHFSTDGDIIPDFVSSRLAKSEKLRGAVRLCFFIQSAFAFAEIIVGAALGGSVPNCVFAALSGVAVIAVAFFALGGGSAEKTVSYIMNLIYAVVCFVLGGTAMYLCGALMLCAAVAALVSFFADRLRRWLLSVSPLSIKEEHYTLTAEAQEIKRLVEETPSEPEKSELQEVAEAFAEIFK